MTAVLDTKAERYRAAGALSEDGEMEAGDARHRLIVPPRTGGPWKSVV